MTFLFHIHTENPRFQDKNGISKWYIVVARISGQNVLIRVYGGKILRDFIRVFSALVHRNIVGGKNEAHFRSAQVTASRTCEEHAGIDRTSRKIVARARSRSRGEDDEHDEDDDGNEEEEGGEHRWTGSNRSRFSRERRRDAWLVRGRTRKGALARKREIVRENRRAVCEIGRSATGTTTRTRKERNSGGLARYGRRSR